MSKDANNSVAAAGKEARNALLVGLLLLLLLILAPLYWVERLQQDLRERSRAALRSGGLDPDAFGIGFDGRDARLVGSQAQAAQLAQARRLVEPVWGVRTVTTRATAADAVAPASTTATAAQEPSTGGMVDVPGLPPSSDSAPPPPAQTGAEPTAAGVEPAPAPLPDPEPAPTAVAPQSAEVSVAEAPQVLPIADLASKPSAAEPVAPEQGAAPATAAPASKPQVLLTQTNPEPAMADLEAPAEPAATTPAHGESHLQAKTGPGDSARKPTSPPIEESLEAVYVNPPAETTDSPNPTATPPGPEPQTRAMESRGAEAGPPESAQEPIREETAAAAGDDTQAGAGELSADTLLTDWPNLAAVEGLRLEMQQDQVWLRGRVNSLADLDRIEAQFPDYAAARHIRLDLELAERSPQELADYLNLVAASFRFRAGTSYFGPAGERAMDRIADTLKSYPGTRLGLAGRAPETVVPQVRRVHARHRAGATYRALLVRGVDGQQLFLADFASPFPPLLRPVPVAPNGPGQIQFFSLER